MIQSVKQQKKKQQDRNGILGIFAILVLAGAGTFAYFQFSNPIDEDSFCPIKGGPKEVTAIVFDKSEQYSKEQVTDIKTSFEAWLSGVEPNSKNRPIDLSFFEEGNLIQLFVTDQRALEKSEGLEPIAQLCVPKDFKEAKGWIDNPDFLEADYQKFVKTFTGAIENLLKKAEGTSPIMETFVRIANSKSFQSHPSKPHNMFIVSDMLQHSDNYSHYRSGEGQNWKNFERKMEGSVFLNAPLNDVNWQVFLALRKNANDRNLQASNLSSFWSNFFANAGAISNSWILIDG